MLIVGIYNALKDDSGYFAKYTVNWSSIFVK